MKKTILMLCMVIMAFMLMACQSRDEVKEENSPNVVNFPPENPFTVTTRSLDDIPWEVFETTTSAKTTSRIKASTSKTTTTLTTTSTTTTTSTATTTIATTTTTELSTTTIATSTLAIETYPDVSNVVLESISFVDDSTDDFTGNDSCFTYIANGTQTWYDICVATRVWTDDLLELNGVPESRLNEIIRSGFMVQIPTYSKWNGQDFIQDPDGYYNYNGSNNSYYEADYNTNYQESNYSVSGQMLGASTLSLSSSWGSWQNIKRSANALNGMVVYAGDAFNWFNYPGLGPCGQAEGYELGGVINSAGEYDMDYGGGICFTVSCLNDCAVWQCGMQPDSGNASHSKQPTYIEWGRDATVDWPGQNYVFYNTTGYDVVFYTSITEWGGGCGGSLTISCYVR